MIKCNSDPYGGWCICVLADIRKEVVESGGTVSLGSHPSEPSDSDLCTGAPQAESYLVPAVFCGLVFSLAFSCFV